MNGYGFNPRRIRGLTLFPERRTGFFDPEDKYLLGSREENIPYHDRYSLIPPPSVGEETNENPLDNVETIASLIEKQSIKNAAPSEKAGLYDEWKKPIFGNMPLDKFVQLAGMGAAAIAPKEWSGRLGAGLAGMAATAEQRRLGYEEREMERAERRERFETLRQEKRLNTLTQFILKSKSPELQSKLYKGYAEGWNKKNPDSPLPTDIEFNENTQEFFKRITEIDKIGTELNWSLEEKNQAKRDVQFEMGFITGKEWGKESLKAPKATELMRGVGGTMVPKEEGAEFYQKPEKPKEYGAENYILSDKSNVLSYDRGRTYIGEDNKSYPMPSDAIKIPGGATLSEVRMGKAQREAEESLKIEEKSKGISPEKAALEGTGPYRKAAAAFNAIAGGLGADIVFGREGIFPDTQENRQILRTIRKLGQKAFLSSSRGAIWDLKQINKLYPDPDTTWTNPRTEAQKIRTLRNVILIEKRFNNEAITKAISLKEVEKLRMSNNDFDKLLALIGTGEPTQGTTSSGNRFTIKELKE